MRWTELPEFKSLPAGWEVVSLLQKASFVAGQSPSSELYNTSGHGLPFLQGNADFGAEHPHPLIYCERPTKKCAVGDTLISVRAPVGELNRANQVYGLGRGLGALHATEIDPDYLFFGMHRWRRPLFRAAQGSTFDAVTGRHFKQLRIAIPIQRREQERIVEIINAAKTAVGDCLSKLAAARRLKTALMQQLFTRGIPARHKKFTKTKWIHAPAKWDVLPLREMAEIVSGFTMGRDLSGNELVSLPYLTVINVQEGRLDLSCIEPVAVKASEVEDLLLRPNDVLMTEGGDRDKLGRGCIWRGELEKCVFQNHIFRIRFKPDTYLPELFHFLLQSWQAKNYFYAHAKQTSNLCTINKRELRRFPVPKPQPDEQNEMLALLKTAEANLQAIAAELKSLQRLKTSLLQNLLTGKVRIKMED
jgi:type I restriction enzyme S subunit